jgi:hypothetical protein
VRIGVNGAAWSGSIYVANVFNEPAMFEAFRDTFYPNIRKVSVARPRTIGFAIKRRF